MSETLASLHRKIEGARELESVVRTMKAAAASQISQYERAVLSLGDYFHTVEMGLVATIRHSGASFTIHKTNRRSESETVHVVVFGSDQGLVGQFNDSLVDFVVKTLSPLPGKKMIWAVGERVQGRLDDAQLKSEGLFPVPNSVSAVTPLVGQILLECEAKAIADRVHPMYLFHNRPKSGAIYEPVSQRLLPLDDLWLRDIAEIRWPTNNRPEVVGNGDLTLRALIREYLFVSLFKACAESLAAENASRLSAMQRAEKNIDELQEDLSRTFHHLRQSSIDEELFDVISGFEALKHRNPGTKPSERTGYFS